MKKRTSKEIEKYFFGEDFLEKFAKLEYGKYMLFADENKELHL